LADVVAEITQSKIKFTFKMLHYIISKEKINYHFSNLKLHKVIIAFPINNFHQPGRKSETRFLQILFICDIFSDAQEICLN